MAAPDLVIVDVNEAYLRATGRSREDLVGRHVFEAFPDTRPDGVRSRGASSGRVPGTGEADVMAVPQMPSRAPAAAPRTGTTGRPPCARVFPGSRLPPLMRPVQCPSGRDGEQRAAPRPGRFARSQPRPHTGTAVTGS
ncbi:PAS domain-containing protein [Streptomyces peucetius]